MMNSSEDPSMTLMKPGPVQVTGRPGTTSRITTSVSWKTESTSSPPTPSSCGQHSWSRRRGCILAQVLCLFASFYVTLYTSDFMDDATLVYNDRQTRSTCLPRVCPLLVTAPFLWLQHVCGTVCRPLSHRRHRCWHSRDDSRQNCLLAVIQTVSCGYIWYLFLFFFPHRSHVSFTLFFYVRCPRSLWHYATLISSFNNKEGIRNVS